MYYGEVSITLTGVVKYGMKTVTKNNEAWKKF